MPKNLSKPFIPPTPTNPSFDPVFFKFFSLYPDLEPSNPTPELIPEPIENPEPRTPSSLDWTPESTDTKTIDQALELLREIQEIGPVPAITDIEVESATSLSNQNTSPEHLENLDDTQKSRGEEPPSLADPKFQKYRTTLGQHRIAPPRIRKGYRRHHGPKTILDLRTVHRRDVDARRGDLVTRLQAHDQLKKEIQDAGGSLRMNIGNIECWLWLPEN